jgi:hypothetical protein
MPAMGLRGAVRGRAWVTTTRPDLVAERPSDLVKRDFTATRSNQFWVAGLTDTATWRGVVYVTFVIDAFPRRIVAIAAVRAVVSAQTSFASRLGGMYAGKLADLGKPSGRGVDGGLVRSLSSGTSVSRDGNLLTMGTSA